MASITESDLECMLFDESAEPKPLPFSLLERITNGFSYKMEVGRGGFAVVYKAILEKGVVAVKRLSNTYMYENEFFREVECLMKVKHRNIVRFLGYCVDTQGNMRMYEGKYVMADVQQRLLCFEYVPNGGLDHYIKDPSCGLEWIDRYDIIKGICEGGYMAPEFVSHLITKKSDLYSLGVIIMEIMTGEKRCQAVETVLKSWSDRLNSSQRNQEREQIRVCVEIGIECTDCDPERRPVNMKHIIERLPKTERIDEILPIIKMLDISITSSIRSLHSLDTDHTKQWIITGEDNGHVRIWNYQTQKKVDSFKLSERSEVVSVKFIERKQWFVAASGYYIYVYSYETKMRKITSIKAGCGDKSHHILAVHPTKPYLLSSDYANIKIWNWDKNWECTHIVEANNSGACIYQIALSSKGTIATTSLDCTVKVCSLDSPEYKYTLSGHSTSVRCLDLFTWDDQEYLVTGSNDQTAKIWDMEQRICLCTLKAMSPVIFVFYRSDLQILVTGSLDGSTYLWRICSRIRRRPPKLEQTVIIGGGDVLALTCSMGRVVLAKKDTIAVMDIDYVNSREKSTDYSELQLSADMRPDGDKTSKVTTGSSEELPILDIHPLELHSSEPNESIMCSLHLTNRTDAHITFRITEESRESLQCSSELPMYGIVPPRSNYTLDVTTVHKMKLEEEKYFNLVVQSSTSGERYIALFISQSECDEFFEEAEEIGNKVHEVTLQAIYVPQRDTMCKYYHELHPLKYRFYPKLNESIPCSLHLTNKTDEHVAFRFMERRSNSLWDYTQCPPFGGVSPRSTCTFIGTHVETMLVQETGMVVLQSCISGDKNIMLLKDKYACDNFFEEAKELGQAVYEVAFYTQPRGETTSELAGRPTIIKKPILTNNTEILLSLDAHPTEPWIVMGLSDGNVSIWNHESKIKMDSFKISDKQVCSIKFHAKKKWIVAVTSDQVVHVYDCACVTQIKKITTLRGPEVYSGFSFGIHPTKPYVVSASMKLWDGDKGWQCTCKFGTRSMSQLTFNPDDPDSFATVLYGDFVEVWSLDSPKPDYTLNGHSARVNCLDFFQRGSRQYLITGSDDCTAKIWDLRIKACIHTMEVFMSPVIYVISTPDRPYLVTCSLIGAVHVWSSIGFRILKTVNFGVGGKVYSLVFLMGSARIAIGQRGGISIMDIEDREANTNNQSAKG